MFVENVLNSLYSILSIDPTIYRNISLIRLHTKKIEKLGEFSFPLSLENWKHLITSKCSDSKSIGTILEYISANNEEFSLQSLCDKSKCWSLPIYKAEILKFNVHLYLNRPACYKRGIEQTLEENESYGSWDMNSTINLIADIPNENDLNISHLRIVKLKEIARNILLFNNCTISDHNADVTIAFSRRTANSKPDEQILIYCAPVLTTAGALNKESSASDYYKQRTIDMRLMAEHKYGVRVTNRDNWRLFFEKLGNAAVTIELMENKPSHSLKLDLNNLTLSNQKNASFIMYNCARLAAIFKEFDKRIASKIYPKLPPFEDVDVELLKEPIEKLGEFSFPLSLENWKHLITSKCSDSKSIGTILEYISANNEEFSLQSLCDKSKCWSLPIYKAEILKFNVHLYLNRPACYKRGIEQTLEENESYGSWDMNSTINLIADIPNENDLNISHLRIVKLKEIARNILLFNNCTISDHNADVTIAFSRRTANSKPDEQILIYCAPVLTTAGALNKESSASDYYKQRTIDMRLMAEHKYGVRVTNRDNWRLFFEKLGNAAVTIELMENKPSHSLKLDLNNLTLSNQKNASFIMYNCARLAAIFKEFDKRIASKIYPKLPPFEDVDVELLKEPDEWELLFVYILQFPCVIKSIIKDIHDRKFNPHFLIAFLSGLASTFSVYYRRVKILCEPRVHLYPILFARIYLLKAVQRVLHNSLHLLNIEPVSQM